MKVWNDRLIPKAQVSLLSRITTAIERHLGYALKTNEKILDANQSDCQKPIRQEPHDFPFFKANAELQAKRIFEKLNYKEATHEYPVISGLRPLEKAFLRKDYSQDFVNLCKKSLEKG